MTDWESLTRVSALLLGLTYLPNSSLQTTTSTNEKVGSETCVERAPSAGHQPLSPGNGPKGSLRLDDPIEDRDIWRDPYLAMSVSRTPSGFTITNSEPSQHPGNLGGRVGKWRGGGGSGVELTLSLFHGVPKGVRA